VLSGTLTDARQGVAGTQLAGRDHQSDLVDDLPPNRNATVPVDADVHAGRFYSP
jgi:hypothetical protein